MSEEKLYAVRNDEGLLLSYSEQGAPLWRVWGEMLADKPTAEMTARAENGHVVTLIEASKPEVVSEKEAKMLATLMDGDLMPVCELSYFVRHAEQLPEKESIEREDRLMRAYVNGWEVEKPKLWNVKVPHATNSYYYDMGWGNGLETQDMKAGTQPLPGFREAQFTQDEINKRGWKDGKRREVTYVEQ